MQRVNKRRGGARAQLLVRINQTPLSQVSQKEKNASHSCSYLQPELYLNSCNPPHKPFLHCAHVTEHINYQQHCIKEL